MNEAAGSSVLEAARKGLRFQTLRGTDRSPGLLARRNRAFGQIWDAPVCTSSAGCRKKASKRCCAVLRRLVPFGCPRKDGSELEKGKAATCWTGWVRVGGLVASEATLHAPTTNSYAAGVFCRLLQRSILKQRFMSKQRFMGN